MLEKEIQDLIRRDSLVNLGDLEADIWRREAEISDSQKASRTLAAFQAVVVIFAIFTSAAFGSSMAKSSLLPHASILNPGASLAPSVLLFGGR
ncbi:MAG: hypothetical protein V4559_11020 [Pseudomonadota bacterium]